MNSNIKFQFLGGVEEVGRLSMVLDIDNLKLLFEYGMSPGKPPKYPMQAPPVDLLLLTHGHLDHSGMIPSLWDRSSFFFKLCFHFLFQCLYTTHNILHHYLRRFTEFLHRNLLFIDVQLA